MALIDVQLILSCDVIMMKSVNLVILWPLEKNIVIAARFWVIMSLIRTFTQVKLKIQCHSYVASPNKTVDSPTVIVLHGSVSSTFPLKPIEIKSVGSWNWKYCIRLKDDGYGKGQLFAECYHLNSIV